MINIIIKYITWIYIYSKIRQRYVMLKYNWMCPHSCLLVTLHTHCLMSRITPINSNQYKHTNVHRESYDSAIQKLPGRRCYDARYSPRRLTADLSVCYPAPLNIPNRKLTLTSRPSQFMLLPGEEAKSQNTLPRDLSNCLSLKEISHGYFMLVYRYIYT